MHSKDRLLLQRAQEKELKRFKAAYFAKLKDCQEQQE